MVGKENKTGQQNSPVCSHTQGMSAISFLRGFFPCPWSNRRPGGLAATDSWHSHSFFYVFKGLVTVDMQYSISFRWKTWCLDISITYTVIAPMLLGSPDTICSYDDIIDSTPCAVLPHPVTMFMTGPSHFLILSTFPTRSPAPFPSDKHHSVLSL